MRHFNPGTCQPAQPQRLLPPGPTLKLLLCKEHSGPEEVAGLVLSPFTSPRKGVKGVLAAGQDTRLLGLQTCGGWSLRGCLTKDVSWEEHQEAHGEGPQPVEPKVPVPFPGK